MGARENGRKKKEDLCEKRKDNVMVKRTWENWIMHGSIAEDWNDIKGWKLHIHNCTV